ncbi:MAG: arginine deiminase family protein [Candidatus Zixiibacteriota bacterium]
MKYGSQSEVGKIKSLLLKHPKDAFISQNNIQRQWKKLNYLDMPDYDRAIVEYDKFMSLLKNDIDEFVFLPQHKDTTLDSIYLHDPVIITNNGVILCNMGKPARLGEFIALDEFFGKIKIPILGMISGEGTVEGGDIVWLDQKTIAVGEGYRTNAEGIRQLKELVSDLVEEFIVVPLPHWRGPSDVLHLMSMISPIDKDLAVVYLKQMPVIFRNYLLNRGMKLIDVPDLEYESMGCNILAISPRKVIMLSGNEWTQNMLETEGVEVITYDGFEISRKGCGGPTCLTRPIYREEI